MSPTGTARPPGTPWRFTVSELRVQLQEDFRGVPQNLLPIEPWAPTTRVVLDIPEGEFEKQAQNWREHPERARAATRAIQRSIRVLLDTLLTARDIGQGRPLSEDPEMKARGLALARQLLSSREVDALESGKDIMVPSPIHPGVVYRIRKWANLRRYAAGRYEASYCVHPAVPVPAIEEATIFAIFIRAGQEGKLLSAANRYVRAGGDT